MVFLINAIPAIIVLLGYLIAYKVKSWKNKLTVIIVACSLVLIYGQVQPSYMPKGTVKPTPTVAFQQLDIPTVDRQLKPKSDEQYDIERKAAIEEIDRDLEEQIKRQQMKLYKE